MASLNRVELIGNLGADPEVRFTTSGEAVANIRLATTDAWKDKNTGEHKEYTEWHRLVLYRRLAEIARDYLKKGAQVFVEGRIRTRKWTDKDNQERYTTEIEVTGLKMLGKREGASAAAQPAARAAAEAPPPVPANMDDDIPF